MTVNCYDKTFTHVDDFIDDYFKNSPQEIYARWVLNHFRLESALKIDFDQFMQDKKLFCTYQDNRYRVVGASVMGDIWLVKDFSKDYGHDYRVCVNECSDWGDKP